MVLAAAGAHVRVFGTLGCDPIGSVIRSMLADAGVRTSDIREADLPTSITVALEAAERERMLPDVARAHGHVFERRSGRRGAYRADHFADWVLHNTGDASGWPNDPAAVTPHAR
ncbi:hypothetical protein [Mesorhizobium cantuariense]|uniref:Carbohydrate kinase PfkB domain-containing protein n=1 Tax=Mesorhizobium cantuariense TaxID=1300275 RepID=A0ABV7MK18_9HYPH